jgi:hypothetical protein
MQLDIPEWTVLLYDVQDQPIMDISELVSLELNMVLNDVSTVQFTMNLTMYERKCAAVNALPRNVLYPALTEMRVLRNGNAMFGGIVSNVSTDYTENGATVSVTADSYIQYFATRYLKKTYTNTDRSAIAWDAINTVQSETNGDLGVTLGTTENTFNSDLEADYRDVKSIIQRYTYAQPTTYDFEITPDKVFNTFLRLGSNRPEIQLVYPQNIRSIRIPRSSDTLYNRVIGLGSGIGNERLETIVNNTVSQAAYRIRETKETFNDVKRLNTLENNAEGVLTQSYEVIVLPEIEVGGNDVDLDLLRVGDSVQVRIDGSTLSDNVDGMFRVYEMRIAIDQNSFETVNLSFYKPDLGGGI